MDRPAPEVSIAGNFLFTPAGVILHGSRSGTKNTTAQEFAGTSNWAQAGAPYKNEDGSIDYLGWNATIGEDAIADHIDCGHWGWNARSFSSLYLAIEFSQPHENDPISDAQIRAFAWWFLHIARARWPELPAVFPTHAELDIQLTEPDHKTDVFVHGDALRAQILPLVS